MDLLEIHIQVALNQVAKVILNVHQIKLALTENVKIHAPSKNAEQMLNVKQDLITQDANVCLIISGILMSIAENQSVWWTMTAKPHYPAETKSVLTHVNVL